MREVRAGTRGAETDAKAAETRYMSQDHLPQVAVVTHGKLSSPTLIKKETYLQANLVELLFY